MPVAAGWRAAGRVRSARHAGSVDVFLEAVGVAQPGDVLVIDNGGRAVGALPAEGFTFHRRARARAPDAAS
jgi:regulator of RNase E activity RraA